MANPKPRARRPEHHDDVVPRSVGRVLDLLEVILIGGPCNLTTAAERADLSPSTALRHLRALEARGYIGRQANGTYHPGPTIFSLVSRLGHAASVQQLVNTAQPLLDELAAETGESVYLAVGDDSTATYVATAESNRAIRHVGWVGQTVPLEGTAVGQALAAPGNCVTKTGTIEPDITAISQAVPNDVGLNIAVSVIGPPHRMGDQAGPRIEAALGSLTAKLGEQLGADAGVAA